MKVYKQQTHITYFQQLIFLCLATSRGLPYLRYSSCRFLRLHLFREFLADVPFACGSSSPVPAAQKVDIERSLTALSDSTNLPFTAAVCKELLASWKGLGQI